MITRTFYTTAVAAVLGMSLTVSNSLFVNSFSPTTTSSTRQQIGSAAVLRAESTTTALFMGRGGGVRTRGLEQRKEGPTPTGTYVLYSQYCIVLSLMATAAIDIIISENRNRIGDRYKNFILMRQYNYSVSHP